MRYVWICLADNDHRNGSFAGEAEAASIGGSKERDLCSLEGPPIAVARKGYTLTINGRRYRVRAYWPWVGNWCWSGYALHAREAARLLQQLRAAGYGPDTAPIGFWGAWYGRRPLTARLACTYGDPARRFTTRRQRRFEGIPKTWRRPGHYARMARRTRQEAS
jgi:hypothetical protein